MPRKKQTKAEPVKRGPAKQFDACTRVRLRRDVYEYIVQDADMDGIAIAEWIRRAVDEKIRREEG